jgi:general secretion pathway protein E/type IV pilus assembly protein PilB
MDLGEILVGRGLLSIEQLQQVRSLDDGRQRPDRAAVAAGLVSEQSVLQAIGDEMGIPYVDLAEADVDLGLLARFPQRIIHRHAVFPVHHDNGSLVVATSDPIDLYPLDELSAATGKPIIPVLALRAEIDKRIKAHLGVGSETIEGLLSRRGMDGEIELIEQVDRDAAGLEDQAEEASVVRLVNEILLEAVRSRASDVHIESQAAGMKVRYRIDGMLQPQQIPAEITQFRGAIISRLKIMARLNIAEKRLPQDGRIRLNVDGREIDVRVSVIPMIHGEGIVMRLLDRSQMVFDMQSLGMADDVRRHYEELIRLPHGIILVTGPTGSGKTTTLYSSLLEIKNEATKIVTAEDPVEYQLEGINQIQVHAKIGLTFAHSLRSVLRHDPDVILVGEIRDLETAESAIQASLTGHLVFSTLHTNDTAGAYTRLIDMGVEPFLVASTVEAVMAQRLVRVLCPRCRAPRQPQREQLPADFPWDAWLQTGQAIYEPVGCRECRQLGYQGRVGIFEFAPTSDAIRQLAHDRASSWAIRRQALGEGMRTLRQDGWLKAISGVTSVDEVLRVTKGDRVD